MMLEELGIINPFKAFMRTNKKLSVDLCKKYLEKQITDILCKRKITDEISNGYSVADHLFDVYNLTYPLSRTTVWRWKRLYGAKWDTIQKSYYTDNHDTEENIKYRLKYIDKLEEISKRMPMWYKKGDERLHVDLLEESLFVSFRHSCLTGTNEIGALQAIVEPRGHILI